MYPKAPKYLESYKVIPKRNYLGTYGYSSMLQNPEKKKHAYMLRQNDLPGVPVSSGFDRGLGVLHLGCSKAGDLGFWRLDLGLGLRI